MKKSGIWKKVIVGALAIALMLGAFPAVNCVRVEAAVKLVNTKGKDAKDVAALKKLIEKAKKQGADVSEDLDDTDELTGQYYWINGKLVNLRWSSCGLTGAWNFSGLKNLAMLNCDMNKLSKLDVSKCTKLENLNCSDNKLSKLDVSKCTKLRYLTVNTNKLSKLDVSKCTKLTNLYCCMNQLSKLDVSKCTELTDLVCYQNQLSKLDVSKCTKLRYLACFDNKLKKVTVSKKAKDLFVSAGDGVKIVKK